MLKSDVNIVYSLDYDLIYSLINQKGISMTTLSAHCLMSPDGFSRALKNKTISVPVLEKLSEFFEVHPGYFFGQDENANSELLLKIKYYKSELELKNKIIKDKEEIIQLLKNQLKK